MKKFMWVAATCFAFLFAISSLADAKDVPVKGYFRSDGTYVAPHHRTAPNGTKNDNYSTKGNVNPYTGEPGTKEGDPTYTTGYPVQSKATPYPSYNYSTPEPESTYIQYGDGSPGQYGDVLMQEILLPGHSEKEWVKCIWDGSQWVPCN